MKKKQFKKKFSNKKPVTTVDKNLDRRLKKIEGEVELKYIDLFINTATIPTEPLNLMYCLNTSVLGTAIGTRIGSDIVAKKLMVRLAVRGTPGLLGEARFRIIIFWYKNSNTLTPLISQVIDPGTGPTAPTLGFYNQYYKESIKVIYDTIRILKPIDWNGGVITFPDIVDISKTISFNRKVKYVTGAGGGTQADILDNSLWFCITTSAGAAANNPNIELSTRLFYADA